eukprot:TRINITY_DN88_c0_g2_i4.p1 TRINITY_DN88_c0_g2~~TRINITY_DN88_c0_g2_i4.p1  ORF type:complete len:306 (-),score=57.29 TRINITY_DN88_c0_g2_i4:92-1009(-)
MPILFLHGWPGSFFECLKLVNEVTVPSSKHNNTVFEVICPSHPGYGFSGHPTERGFNDIKIAGIYKELMNRLGYKEYLIQGGDWGAFIGIDLAYADPENCKALHLNLFPLSQFNKGFIATVKMLWRNLLSWSIDLDIGWFFAEGAYFHIQSTKPDTLTIGHSDSPAALAAWIIEKWRSWSDCNGNLEAVYTKDELLTNVMIYWVNNAAGSAARFYYESFRGHLYDSGYQYNLYVTQPTAYLDFKAEVFHAAQQTTSYYLNLVHYKKVSSGGHFAAMERPEFLADDLYEFYVEVLAYYDNKHKQEL